MNTSNLTFTANDQELVKNSGMDEYASNTVSYIKATFTLGTNWSGFDSVRAVWSSYYNVISTVLDTNNSCMVPAEMLLHKSKVQVNLVGSIVENNVLTDRLTTFPVEALKVSADAKVSGSETAPVTPSQFEQFVDSVEAAAQSVTDYSYDSEAWAKGTRGGTAVSSSDPTYHNNSKYWNDQGAALSQEVTNLRSNLDASEENIGIKNAFVKISNGTQANPGNPNCVHTSEIPVSFGDVIEFKTDRPLASGVTYSSYVTWLRADKSYYSETDWVSGFESYLITDTNIAYAVFSIGTTSEALRESDFYNYKTYVEVKSDDNISKLFKAETNLIPTMRNGSVANPGNTTGISTLMALPVNEVRRLTVEFIGEMDESDHLTWVVEYFKASAKGKTSSDAYSSDYIVEFEFAGDEGKRVYDLTESFSYNSTKSAEYFAIAVWRADNQGNDIPLRIDDFGDALRINYYNDPAIDAIRQEIETIIPRETFAYLGNGGHFVFKDFPRFGASTGRCALRTDSDIITSVANHEVTAVTWEEFVSQIGSSDTLVADGHTWLYLRTGYAVVFDVVNKVYKAVQITGAVALDKDYIPILMAWAQQFVGGLLCSKVYDEMYSVPNTLFNSSNVLYPIDVKAKATEFADIISENTDSESFLFFTDPHTYSRYWNTLESAKNSAEYLQTVIQKYYNSTPTNFVLCGGDWLTDTDTVSEAKYKLGLIESSMESMVSPYYPIFGNHDSNYQGAEELSIGEVTNLWFSKWGRNYYTFNGANTTFYVFDSQLDNISSMTPYFWEQIDWFGKSLEPENSNHIAVAIHIWSNGDAQAPLTDNIKNMITAYNQRQVIELNNVEYDFSEAIGRIEFVVSGHVHTDSYDIVDESVPVIITTNAWRNPNVCFDLVFADYTAKTIDCIRVGEGSNRKFSLTTGEPIN